MGFPGSSVGKEFTCNVGDLGLIPGLGRSPGGGHGSPLQYSRLENPLGQRSLMGYSPWGHKGSDLTEPLRTRSFFKRYFWMWILFKVFIEFEYCFYFRFFFFLATRHAGSLLSHQGLNPHLLLWKGKS